MEKLSELFDFTLFQFEKYSLHLSDLLIILAIFGGTKILLSVLFRLIERHGAKTNVDEGRRYAIYQIIKYVLWIGAIGLSLEMVGVRITLLLAGSAALLLGLGFGIQQIFNDFVSGLILLFEGTIQINDVVQMKNGTICKVKDIGLRTSKVMTRDNIIIIVPNSRLVSDEVINWTHIDIRTRFLVEVQVAYDSDPKVVRKVLLEAVKGITGVAETPNPFVRLEDFANHGMRFGLYFWSDNVFRIENVKSEVRFTIFEGLKQNGITIPFPQQDIYIKQMPEKNQA